MYGYAPTTIHALLRSTVQYCTVTSAPIWHLNGVGSKRSMRLMELFPSSSPFQNSSTPVPTPDTTPSPVTTTFLSPPAADMRMPVLAAPCEQVCCCVYIQRPIAQVNHTPSLSGLHIVPIVRHHATWVYVFLFCFFFKFSIYLLHR